MPDESVPIFESVGFVYDKATSRSLHKLDKVDMDRFSSHKRRIRERFAR